MRARWNASSESAVGSSSRRKGRDGENELRKQWVGAGWEVTAAQRNLGGAQGDALVTRNGVTLHVEGKRRETLAVPAWIKQAETECKGRPWAVCFRRSREPWYAVLPLDTLFALLEERGEP